MSASRVSRALKRRSGAEDRKPGWFEVLLNTAVGRPTIIMLLAGLVLILGGAVETLKFPSVEISFRGYREVLLFVGLGLCVPSLVAPVVGAFRRQGVLERPYPLPPEANNVDFMFHVFYDAMPPAFVKSVDSVGTDDGRVAAHDIMYSQAFQFVQGEIRNTGLALDEESKKVMNDFSYGDTEAYRHGQSYQLEVPPIVEPGRLPILTVKRSFEHGGRHYIAGWYLPVDLKDLDIGDAPNRRLTFRRVFKQLQVRPLPDDGREDVAVASIGQALLNKHQP